MAPSAIKKLWGPMYGSSVFENGRRIVEFINQHHDQHGQLRPVAPCQRRMLKTLFETVPAFSHVVHELMEGLESVVYFDCVTLAGDDEVHFADFVMRCTQPNGAPFSPQDRPYTAVQTQPLTNPMGLLRCNPRQPTLDMFPTFPFSPFAYFAREPERTVIANSAGAFTAPHIDIGFTSGFSTVIGGTKISITFDVSERNWKVMQRYQLQQPSWDQSIRLMRRELEGPRFNVLKAGDTIYIAPGQPHMVLSPTVSALYGCDAANPFIKEWDAILMGHQSMMWAIKNVLAKSGTFYLREAIRDLECGLNLWKNVKGLPQKRTDDTVAQSEVDNFVAEQEACLETARNILNHELEARLSANAPGPSDGPSAGPSVGSSVATEEAGPSVTTGEAGPSSSTQAAESSRPRKKAKASDRKK
ncbi:hypothetical protein PANT_22c00016 [Moesziomyces antarcticus T-34]|uniref:JmjC domain-containing protein n=1 Tax=Pseudozyma antarctica (strain T-34) TaxID=1151754 RepID=M9LS84_PSEA3|nr:hypothetical protein PANT_22c00016 [Moesziomyces antarcticus T-34]